MAISKKGEQKADGKNSLAGQPISPRVAHHLDFWLFRPSASASTDWIRLENQRRGLFHFRSFYEWEF